MDTVYNKKDLIGLRELSKEEILYFLDSAQQFKDLNNSEIKKINYSMEKQ